MDSVRQSLKMLHSLKSDYNSRVRVKVFHGLLRWVRCYERLQEIHRVCQHANLAITHQHTNHSPLLH